MNSTKNTPEETTHARQVSIFSLVSEVVDGWTEVARIGLVASASREVGSALTLAIVDVTGG